MTVPIEQRPLPPQTAGWAGLILDWAVMLEDIEQIAELERGPSGPARSMTGERTLPPRYAGDAGSTPASRWTQGT